MPYPGRPPPTGAAARRRTAGRDGRAYGHPGRAVGTTVRLRHGVTEATHREIATRLKLTDAKHFAAKLQDFGLGDRLDLRQFDPATTTLSFAENGTNTAGVLTVTDGSLTAKITLLGQYMTSGFHTASDGLPGGTFVTYTPQAAAALATPHS